MKDPIMGSMPVAIVDSGNCDSEQLVSMKRQAQELVASKLGASYRLAGIYTVKELGLTSFPTTATGKVKKSDLLELLSASALLRDSQGRRDISVETLIGIWQHVLGQGNEVVEPNTRVVGLADSLVMMRFRFYVERDIGVRLSMIDILEHETPAEQALLAQGRANEGQLPGEPTAALVDRLLGHNIDNIGMLPIATQRRIEACVANLGLSITADVESYCSPHDTLSLFSTHTTRPASDNVRWALRTKAEASPELLRSALAKCLARHSNFRTIVVPLEDNTTTPRSMHVVVKVSDRLLDRIMEVSAPIESPEILQRMLWSPHLPYANAGGQSLRFNIVPITGSDKPGVIMSAYHAVFDAMSASRFLEELDTFVAGGQPHIPQWIPYSTFAQVYHSGRDSNAALASEEYQMEKLRDLDNVEQCLWPPLRGPGLLSGDDRGWRYPDGTPGNPSERIGLPQRPGIPKGVVRMKQVDLPDLPVIKSERSIEAHVLAKAAVAIFNVEQTKQGQAIFSNAEAGRTWPFLDAATQNKMPNPMFVNGFCMGRASNIIKISPSEEAGVLLQRLAADAITNSEHCHAPWERIASRLGPEKTSLMVHIAMRQFFNWDSSAQTHAAQTQQNATALERLGRAGTMDRGFMWNFGFVNPRRMSAFVLFDNVHMNAEEAEGSLIRVLEILKWLSRADNWDKHLSQILV